MIEPGMAPNPTTPRFHHYRTSIDMGEGLPSSVSTRGGSATRTWVGRAQRTARVESGVSGLSFLLVPQIGGAVIGGFMLFILIVLFFDRNKNQGAGAIRTPEEQRRFNLRFGIVTFVVLFVAGVAGYFAGSVISIDNTTSAPIVVVIDGNAVPLAPRSFIDQRVWGSNVDIEIRANGQLVEGATVHLDDNPGDAIVRSLFGNGRYVYAVCGLNSYSLQTAHYGR